MSRIFISYKRVDKEKVFKIKDQIESALGEKCWIDLDGIESDAQFKNVIIRAINESEIVLFMYSKAHSKIMDFEKDWTVRELNFAAKKNKRIVFINLDGSPLTDTFEFDYGTKQQVDGQSAQSLSRLNIDLKRWLGIKEPETPITRKNIEENIEQSKEKRINLSFLTQNKKGCVLSVSVLMVLCIVFILPIKFYNSGDRNIASTLPTSNVQDSILSNEALSQAKTTSVKPQNKISEKEPKVLSSPTGIANGYSYVDLGLSVKWATSNVGAKNPDDFGSFYSWGETSPKNEYDTNDYFDKEATVYNNENGKNHIDPSSGHDVAQKKMGGGWRLPTLKEQKELNDKCEWTWYSLNGTNGCIVKGPNGNSIFLPAAGSREGSKSQAKGTTGYYWSSTLCTYYSGNACFLSFSKDKHSADWDGGRGYGYSIRAVIK